MTTGKDFKGAYFFIVLVAVFCVSILKLIDSASSIPMARQILEQYVKSNPLVHQRVGSNITISKPVDGDISIEEGFGYAYWTFPVSGEKGELVVAVALEKWGTLEQWIITDAGFTDNNGNYVDIMEATPLKVKEWEKLKESRVKEQVGISGAEAEAWLLEALASREESLGPDHLAVATMLNNLAEFYRYNRMDYRTAPLPERTQLVKKLAQIEPSYKRALEIREKVLGQDHPKVAQTLIGLSKFYRAEGRNEEAKRMLERAKRIRAGE